MLIVLGLFWVLKVCFCSLQFTLKFQYVKWKLEHRLGGSRGCKVRSWHALIVLIFVFTKFRIKLHQVILHKSQKSTLQFQIIGGVLLKRRGGPTDNLNINKRGVQTKGRGSENCARSEVATRSERGARGASHQLAFMGNCLTISHTFLSLLQFWCVVFLLLKKNETAYILG